MKHQQKPSTLMSRRDFLKVATVASGAALLVSCAKKATEAVPTTPPTQPPPPPPPTATQPPPPTATTAPAATSTVQVLPTATATLGPTPDAKGCLVDWFPTYPPFEKYTPPLEISVPFNANYTFAVEGDDITNNPMYNRVLNNLGIKYIPTWQASGGEYYTRLNNDLAANTLPEAFICRNRSLGQFIDAGAIEDITDIWESTASDLTKQKKGYPDNTAWRELKRDGRIFGVQYFRDGVESDCLAFIRQDWLDKVGKQAPKTLDEWTDVAKAFKTAGLAEFPIGACQNLITYSFSMDPVFGGYGVMPETWLKGDDGKLRYASLEPAVKEALAFLKTWYDEGLIDPDFINVDESGPGDQALAGKLGLFFYPWWLGHAVLPDVYAAFPDAKFILIPLPTGSQGKKGRNGTAARGNGVLFRKGLDPKKIEAMIKQLNWQIDLHVNWEKYKQYGESFQGAGFFRGYEWDLDETCKMIAGLTPDAEWMLQRDLIFGYPGMTYADWQGDIFKDMAKWVKADQSTLNMAQKFILSNRAKVDDMEYYNYAIETLNEVIPNEFLGANTEAINSVLSDLLDLEHSTFLEMITGARALDEFEDFTSEWMDRGGTIYTEEVNKWAASNP